VNGSNDDGLLLVFVSDSGVEVLKRAKTISVYGTFNSCPAPFLQVSAFKEF
jgi:hypothetical protein